MARIKRQNPGWKSGAWLWGRKRSYGGKVNVKKIDKRKWKRCYKDDDMEGYELKAWCVALKRIVKVVYLESKKN